MALVQLDVVAKIEQAVEAFQHVGEVIDHTAEHASSAFDLVGTAIKGAAGAFAAFAVGKGFASLVEAGLEAEKSTQRLAGALRLAGDFSEQAVHHFEDLATAVSRKTAVDREAIVDQIAYLKALGATDDQAQKVIQASVQLSAVTGKDLNTSVNLLAKSYQGVATGLGKVIPGIANLSKAQLAQGAAVDLVRAKFAGFAEDQSTTVSGSIKKTENALDDAARSIGLLIVTAPAVRAVFQAIADAALAFADAISKVKLEDIGNAFSKIASFATVVLIFPKIAQGIALASGAIELFSVNLAIAQARNGAGIFTAVAAGANAAAISIDLARISATLFKATLTLGLTLALDALIQFVANAGGISNAFEIMGAQIKKVFSEIAAAITGTIADILEGAAKIPDGIGGQFEGAAKSAREFANNAKANVDEANKTLQKFNKTAVETGEAISAAAKEGGKLGPGLSRSLEDNRQKIEEQIKALSESLKNAGKTAFETAASDAGQRVTLINKALKLGVLNNQQANDLILKSNLKLIDDTTKAQDAAAEELRKQNQQQVEDMQALADIFSGKARGPGQKGDANNVSVGNVIAIGAAKAASFLVSGAEGAKKLIGAGISAGLSAALGPLGQVIGPIASEIFDAFAQGPAKVTEMVTGFLQGIPTIIENVLLSVPALIQALIENIPQVIDRLVEEVPRVITEGIIPRIPDLIVALTEGLLKSSIIFAAQMPLVAARLGVELALQAPSIAAKTIDAFVKEAPRFITELIKSIPSGIGSAAGGIGGSIGGALGGIGDIFGFADGGRIPNVPSLRGDRGLTKVDAGEQIFSRDLSGKLEQFLNGNGDGGKPSTATVNVVLGKEQVARLMLELSREGWRIA